MCKKLQDSVDNIEKIRSLYQSGFSVKKIAKMFDVGQTSMFRFFDKNNIKTRSKQEALALKHLTLDQEKEVWNLYYNSGLNREEIAKQLNFSQYSVRSIIDGNCLSGKEKFKLNFEKNSIALNYEQRQLILGSLLGDASLSIRDHNGSKDQLGFKITHGAPQEEYLRHKAKILNSNIYEGFQSEHAQKGAGKKYFTLSYYNKYELYKIHNICFIDGRKSITPLWLKEIDSLALAYWFMDDGSSTYSQNNKTINVKFATQSFNENENNMLRDKLFDFGIESTLQKANGGTEINIYIRQNSVNLFMDSVSEHINIPCMLYKIKRK